MDGFSPSDILRSGFQVHRLGGNSGFRDESAKLTYEPSGMQWRRVLLFPELISAFPKRSQPAHHIGNLTRRRRETQPDIPATAITNGLASGGAPSENRLIGLKSRSPRRSCDIMSLPVDPTSAHISAAIAGGLCVRRISDGDRWCLQDFVGLAPTQP